MVIYIYINHHMSINDLKNKRRFFFWRRKKLKKKDIQLSKKETNSHDGSIYGIFTYMTGWFLMVFI